MFLSHIHKYEPNKSGREVLLTGSQDKRFVKGWFKMPHCIVEYTDNLGKEAAIPALLEKIAAKFRDSNGVFPTGGIRVRAIRLAEYVIADGKGDDAFVNVTAKIGPGRDT